MFARWLWLALFGPGALAPAQAASGSAPDPSALTTSADPCERQSDTESDETDWARRLRVGGGVALYFYQPTNGWKNQFLIYTNLRFDAKWQAFGVHFEPRLSNEKLRPHFDGLAWIQEAYFFFEQQPFTLKAGKLYKQVGLFWDNSFYGNIQVYEGLKFDPNSGLSLEGAVGKRWGLNFWAQYLIVDGKTNASLTGRDTLSVPNSRRRNTLAGRLLPFVRLSPIARLELGLSGERFTADLSGDEQIVNRIAADLKLTWGGFGVWGEALHQSGRHVTDFPYAGDAAATPAVSGRTSRDNTYLLAGAEYTFESVITARYNLSLARYSEVDVREVLHLPSVGLSIRENLSLLAEYASWRRSDRAGSSDVDQSLNFTLMGRY